MTIKAWVDEATKKLATVDISSARLDAELILARALNLSRTWLIAHSDKDIDESTVKTADTWLERRLKREPLAYMFGSKEFYGRDFTVTPDVLIPRPDSETIIELLKRDASQYQGQKLLDVGTGSGAIAITAKLEFPELKVSASDISPKALVVAEANADKLRADVEFAQSDLLANIDGQFDIIVANLPYVDKSWTVSPETDFEPSLALYASDDGLELINQLMPQAVSRQPSGGKLLLEADSRQHQAIIKASKEYGYQLMLVQEFIVVLEKV